MMVIRESFVEAVKALEKAHVYQPHLVSELISLSNKVSYNHSQTNLQEMFRKCVGIVHSIPDLEYKLHIDIIETFAKALVELGKIHNKVTRYFDGMTFDSNKIDFKKFIKFSDPHLFAMALYLNLAVRLEDLGLPGEAFNFLIKSFDPWVQLYDRDSAVGDVETKNIALFDSLLVGSVLIGMEGNRKVLIGRAAMHFRLLKIIGDIESNSLTTYIKTEEFVLKGKEAAYEDILFLTEYLELIALKKDKHVHYDKIVRLLIDQYKYDKQRKNHEFSLYIACTLAKVSNSSEWVNEALTCIKPDSLWTKKYEVKALNILLNVRVEKQVPQIIKIVEEFLTEAATFYDDRMLFELFKHKSSDFINKIIVHCIEKGQHILAVELAVLWCTSKNNRKIEHTSINENIILAIPNYSLEGGCFLIYDSKSVSFMRVLSDRKLSDVLHLKQKVEANWFSVLENEETLERYLGNRHEVEISKQYIEVISEYINIEQLVSILAQFPDNSHFQYLELSWTNTPVVSLLSSRTNHSYSVPIDNFLDISKAIKKVLIWANPDGSLPLALREVEAFEYLLNENNIPYEIFLEEDCTRSLFLEKYKDPSYDLIWISAHGKFNSDNPPFSELYIDSYNETVTAWELQKITPTRFEKRKLILNACESGTAGVRFNSMGFVGIAPSITTNSQTVLGHLWVADSLSSSVYGIFMMNELLRGNTLANAAKVSTNELLSGNNNVINKLTEINSNLDIIDRVKNWESKDLSIPFYSMSAVVFN